MRSRRSIVVGVVFGAIVTFAPMVAVPAGANPSATRTTTVTSSWGSTTFSWYRTKWSVKVSGTIKASGSNCAYAKATLDVSMATDPSGESARACGKNATKSYSFTLTPGKGRSLDNMKFKVCRDITALPDPCSTQVTVAVPAEKAKTPGLKASADSYKNMSMSSFLAAKKSKPGGFDWSDDGCSSPTGDAPGGYNFKPSCQRHDFGYRNYGKGLQVAPTDAQRLSVDQRFLADMNNVCAAQSNAAKRTACKGWAQTYYTAVRDFGGKAFYQG